MTAEKKTRSRAAEIRVLIAKDALAGLASGKLTAESGTYFEADVGKGKCSTKFDKLLAEDGVSLQSALSTVEQCTVCAIGAVFTAAVVSGHARVDFHKATADEVTPGDKSFLIEDDRMRETLRKYFSREQIGLMESAFEKSDFLGSELEDERYQQYGVLLTKYRDREEAAVAFGARYPSDRKRLEAILKNIIDNNGEFKP